MNIDEYLKIHNRCPYCRNYPIQGGMCKGCKFKYQNDYRKEGEDNFIPTDDWMKGVDDLEENHEVD